MNEKIYLALLHKIGLNHKKLHLIFSDNTCYKDFYNKLSSDVLFTYGYTPKQIEFILENKNKYNIAYIENILKLREVNIIDFFDNNYPELLKNISNPPFIIYLRGVVDDAPKIAVVGSRNITSYGEKIIDTIVSDVSKYFTIISGGAAGCDTKAHICAIKNNKKTISVIGTGIDIDYPVGNKKLYDEIVLNGGGVISIFPVGEVGNSYNFPVRNEIVAGLSAGVLVVEAKKKSGTLITSNLALDLGKELFAVPGDIFKNNSDGCNYLIQSGMAKLVTQSSDLLEEFNISKKIIIAKKIINFSDDLEEKIYNLLLLESFGINEISIKIGYDIKTISFKLSMLEINNLIKKGIGGKYEVF